ncbi:MAG: beta-mannosidase [Clostridia bacterium]|nr:beta-mannosidase [Clostridia bacterium]
MILWGDIKLERIWFDEGSHTVSILKFWGWTQIDSVSLVPSDAIGDDIYDVPSTLVNPAADENSRRLFKYLTDVYGDKVLTGQYADQGINSDEFKAIYELTNEYPAILGLDLIDYTPSRVARGTRGKSVEKAIEYWNKGGIVTFAWHWNAPEEYLTGTWYSAFYTDHTGIDLAKIMSGEDQKGYDLLIRDIDAIAVQLKKLQDAGVPVLWRPLHEASGGWFWWGAKGADAYIQLYRLLYDRLTNVHGLNNLIWVWNGQNADWYPGDEYVDMIGWDIYAGEHAYSSQSAVFLDALRVTDKKMMVILSENGTVPDIDLIFRDDTLWGSYATWSGDFVIKNKKLSEQYTEKEILEKMYKDDRTVSLDDLPDLKTYPY